jgi:predicted nucleic acid-binding protein
MAGQKRLSIFLDSNVLFSAIYNNKNCTYPSIIVNLSKRKVFNLFISTLVKSEVRHNILKKIPKKIWLFKEIVKETKIVQDVEFTINPIISLPRNDRIILGTAIYYNMDCFITGNTKDFSEFIGKKICNTIILKPKDFFTNFHPGD